MDSYRILTETKLWFKFKWKEDTYLTVQLTPRCWRLPWTSGLIQGLLIELLSSELPIDRIPTRAMASPRPMQLSRKYSYATTQGNHLVIFTNISYSYLKISYTAFKFYRIQQSNVQVERNIYLKCMLSIYQRRPANGF